MNLKFSIVLLLSHSAFAAAPTPPVIDVTNFLPSIQTVLHDVQTSDFNSSVCASYLKVLEDEIIQIDVRKISPELFNRDAQTIADTSWQIRESLHSRLPDFNLACVNQIQSSFRQFRFIEDYVLERVTQVKDMYPEGKDFEKEV